MKKRVRLKERLKERLKNNLSKLHPLTIFFLVYAFLFALIGFLSGFQYKVINMVIVILSAINALLFQYMHENKKN